VNVSYEYPPGVETDHREPTEEELEELAEGQQALADYELRGGSSESNLQIGSEQAKSES
jgi:hypothetical protein